MPTLSRSARRSAFAVSVALLALTAGAATAGAADQTGASGAAAGQMRPQDLPGVPSQALESRLLVRGVDSNGNETVARRTVRAPGTRAPIHFHDHGGLTCVLEGEMTLYLAGAEPQRAIAGDCYYMPSGRQMSGVNSGNVNAVLLDIFTVPEGTPVWRVVEEGMQGAQGQFSDKPPAK